MQVVLKLIDFLWVIYPVQPTARIPNCKPECNSVFD